FPLYSSVMAVTNCCMLIVRSFGRSFEECEEACQVIQMNEVLTRQGSYQSRIAQNRHDKLSSIFRSYCLVAIFHAHFFACSVTADNPLLGRFIAVGPVTDSFHKNPVDLGILRGGIETNTLHLPSDGLRFQRA